jgi:hypothetical protein
MELKAKLEKSRDQNMVDIKKIDTKLEKTT